MGYIKTFKGLIAHKTSSDAGTGLYIIDDKGEFEDAFADDFPDRATVTVRYAIKTKNEWPETLDEVAADFLSVLEGASESKYYARYSEITGYLWTEEGAKVGGHDLLHILYGNVGKFLWMEVKYDR
jgi:hypothetical protein